MAMESKQTRLGRLIFNPNFPSEDVPVGGAYLTEPRFSLQLPENFSAERHKKDMLPPWVNRDYQDYYFESALEIAYDIPGDPPTKHHFIWIIYGSGGK